MDDFFIAWSSVQVTRTMNGLRNRFRISGIFLVVAVLQAGVLVGSRLSEETSVSDELSEGLPHIKPTTNEEDNLNHYQDKDKNVMNLTTTTTGQLGPPAEALSKDNSDDYMHTCPSRVECSKLGGECINCKFNMTCVYGAEVTVDCEAKRNINCTGRRTFRRSMICRYCYQTPRWQHTCKGSPHCRVVSAPRDRHIANCTVSSEVICLGNRKFLKHVLCDWTAGYRWTTTLVLSITLGGFGADRFYLGHWQEGIGKLFSFGGLGVWTLIDVILIAIGYLGPADGSLYIW